MTELEKTERAKMYLDKLANGINPIDDTPIPDTDTLNNVRLARCFFYVSDILRQVIENGGITAPVKNPVRVPFCLTNEQRNRFVPSDTPISVSELTRRLNDLADPDQCRRLSHNLLTGWLIEIGALEVRTEPDGKEKKHPTPQGIGLGITEEIRTGRDAPYRVVVYDKAAQQFILDNIDAVASSAKVPTPKKAGNQGRVWTPEQDTQLTELFRQNRPVSELSTLLNRTDGGIRARLVRLGLIDARDDV